MFLIKQEFDYKQYADTDYLKNYIRKQSNVKLHDDFIQYIWDALQWVPSLNPETPQITRTYGLNYYGITIINKEGSEIFHHVMESWASLFLKGLDPLILTGSWIQTIDNKKSENEGNHKKSEFQRDRLVNKLKTLANYANLVTGDEYFILDWGI
uniref:Uncharacterized protein n=2 Tax=Desertifilum tharense IPPAS B-1220 TaxID=1781255 RepID=A0A1E5QM56_9CYAN|nr:hypothetical protein BH720_09305 [Desertifilum tharense IPPAS B-1220]